MTRMLIDASPKPESLARLRRERDRFRREARIDLLTGVLNLRGFGEVMATTIRHLEAAEESFALVLLDLKAFGAINDSRGHLWGNHVLAAFASALRSRIHRDDIVGRFGGDEFMIMLRGVRLERDLQSVLRRLEGPYVVHSGRRRIRLSAYAVGVIATRRNALSVERIVHRRLRLVKESAHSHRSYDNERCIEPAHSVGRDAKKEEM